MEFDSVFNRTAYSIALGSPDVVLMFAKGIHYKFRVIEEGIV